MKLIYLTSARLPTEKAHGYQIAKMCEAFSEEGIEVELIAPKRLNPLAGDFSAFYNLRLPIKVTYLPCWDWEFIPWYWLRFWVMILSFGFNLNSYLKKSSYDQIYLRENFLSLFVRDYIMEVHMLPEKPRFYHRFLWKRAAAFSALTSHICKEIGKQVPGRVCLVSPDGVDLSEFSVTASQNELRQRFGLPLDKTIILYTGSFYLYSWKGIDVLLEAAKYFDSNFLFVLVGGNESDIKKIREQYDLKSIHLVGKLPHFQIPAYQQAADILVLPNKSGDRLSEECTSPLKLFEYMASDRPIVASDLLSIREILNENNAVLVNPNSPEDLSQGIKKILADQEKSKKLARQAKIEVEQYTWKLRARKIISQLLKPSL